MDETIDTTVHFFFSQLPDIINDQLFSYSHSGLLCKILLTYWRLWQVHVDVEITIPKTISHGKDEMDLKTFLITYDNVSLREKDEDAKAARLFAYLAEESRPDYRPNFITGWTLTDKDKNCAFVCSWLIYGYANMTNPDELI